MTAFSLCFNALKSGFWEIMLCCSVVLSQKPCVKQAALFGFSDHSISCLSGAICWESLWSSRRSRCWLFYQQEQMDQNWPTHALVSRIAIRFVLSFAYSLHFLCVRQPCPFPKRGLCVFHFLIPFSEFCSSCIPIGGKTHTEG